MTSPGEKPVPLGDKVAEIITLYVDVEKVARSFELTDKQVATLDRIIAKRRPVMSKDGMIVLFIREPGTRSPAPSAQGEPEAAR